METSDGADAIEVSEEDFPAFRDLGNGLSVFYLLDEGDYFAYVQRKDLLGAGITEEVLHDTAIANLETLCAGTLEVREYGEIFAVTLDGSFEASLLLLDRLWETTLRETSGGEYVACIPSRDVLAYSNPNSMKGVRELRDIVERVWAEDDHLITRTLYMRNGGAWNPYMSNHALHSDR